MNKRAKYFLTATCALGMVLLGTQAFAAHPDETACVPHWDGVSEDICGPAGGDVPLRSAAGAIITGGTSVPYSPKATCGICHDYESSFANATKEHEIYGNTQSYQVPYPQHGVSAGYHFQQGRNHDWGATQKHFYHLPEFTSSGGMWGKY
jgi:hypothetical protein